MAQFKPSEKVRLKSGGPVMIVQKIVSDSQVLCQWFAGTDLKDGMFPPDSLEPVGKVTSYRLAATRKGL